MAEYEVRTNQLKGNANSESTISGEINALSEEIRSVAARINLDSASEGAVKNNLRALAESNQNNAEKVRMLSNTLESIVACYEQTERRIANNTSSDKNGIKDLINDIINKIRKIENSLGLDDTAFFSDDPVNLSNGNYVYEKNFFHFDTILPMNLRFFYNGKGQEAGVLGKGWMHSFERRVYKKENTLRILEEDGSEQIFIQKEGGWIACPGSFGELNQTENGYVFVNEEGYISDFDADGKLLSMATRDGWTITLHYENNFLLFADCTDNVRLHFSYDNQGNLIRVTDHTGRTVSVTYQDRVLVSVKDSQGNVTKYKYNKEGYLSAIITPLGNVGLYNEYDSQGRTAEQTFPDGGKVKYLYDEEEGTVTMIRQNGAKEIYVHDSRYRNTKIIYADGEETTTFDENNRKTSFTDKLGNQFRYTYDEEGRLTGFINALGNKMQYIYTDSGQLKEIQVDGVRMASCEFDDIGHQIATINARGFQTRFLYDELGRVVKMVHEDGSETSLSYDENGNIVLVDDPLTGKTQYLYDDCRRVVKTTDALGNETEYAYDILDNLTEVTNAKGDRRTYTYDAQGNINKIEDFNHGVVLIEYNAMNKPVHVKDADGNSTYYEYDLMSNVTKVIAADGAETTYEYDLDNRKTKIIYPSGGEEKAVYDIAGNLIKRVAQDGGIYRFTYDALGRTTEITEPAGGTRRAVFDNLGNVTDIFYEDGSGEHFEFDLMGNCVLRQDKNGYIRYYSYDALNNLTQVRDEKGVLEEYSYLPGGKLLSKKRSDGAGITYHYDAIGNIVRMESSTEGIWNFTYDSLGQVIQSEHENVGIEKYEYDAIGNVTAVIDGAGNRSEFDYSLAGDLLRVTDPEGVQTGYRYDGCHRLTDILQPESGRLDIQKFNEYNRSQKEIRITSYTRNIAGNIVSVTDPEGNRSEYEYDLCGRITAYKDAEGNITQCTYRKDGTEESIRFQDGRTIKYQYDALKRLEQIEDWLGITRFQRDAEGRLLRVTDHQNRTTSYQWDDRGECTEIIYPDESRVSYQYDEFRRLVKTIHNDQTAEYAYYSNGMRKEKIMQDGLRNRYCYNSAGQISELCHISGDKILNRYQYFYDECGRKNRIIETHDNLSDSLDNKFSYNAVGSLCSVERDDGFSERYVYDIFGNRTASVCNGVQTTYKYNRLNQMTESIMGDQTKQYTYDLRGNLSGMMLNGIQRLNLHFDALNRLSTAQSDQGEAVYEYNGLDMLVGAEKTIGSQRIRETYSYDYTKPFYNLLAYSRDEQRSNYVWDQELLFETGDSGSFVFLNDERMNPVGLFSDGSLQERYTYDVWGNQTSEGVGRGNLAKFGFTGYQTDSVTGFYHAGKRKYDSKSGRFIAQDPVAGSAYRPITCNPFIYCACDPINRYDPTGAVVAWLAGGIIGAVANTAAKIAGDIVESVKTGHVSVSPWQEYVGTFTGGFVEGTVFVASGGNAAVAGAAGGAAETFVSNGLNMATGTQGYRQEDGYNLGKLFMDTAISGTEGAVTGFAFNKATKYIKIPGITSGRGNWDAVVRGKLTAASHGFVKNIGIKTIMKGVVTQGLFKTIDTVIDKGKKEIGEWIKSQKKAFLTMFLFNRTAKCPAAGL